MPLLFVAVMLPVLVTETGLAAVPERTALMP
jgi:hypothetical protein